MCPVYQQALTVLPHREKRTDQTRPDQTRPDQTRAIAQQTKRDQSRPDENTTDQNGTDENRTKQTRAEKNRPDQTRSDQNKRVEWNGTEQGRRVPRQLNKRHLVELEVGNSDPKDYALSITDKLQPIFSSLDFKALILKVFPLGQGIAEGFPEDSDLRRRDSCITILGFP